MRDTALVLAWLVIGSFFLGMLGELTDSRDSGLYKVLTIAISLAAVVTACLVIF